MGHMHIATFRLGRLILALAILTGLGGLANSLDAQKGLYIIDGHGNSRLIVKIEDDGSVWIAEKGQAKPRLYQIGNDGPWRGHELRPAPTFYPAFVQVDAPMQEMFRPEGSIQQFGATILHAGPPGADSRQQVRITLRFSTRFQIPDAFLVVIVHTTADPAFFGQELTSRQLYGGAPCLLEFSEPINVEPVGYEVHVFSHGLEVFTSLMSRPEIEAALGKMAADRIKGATTANPRPLTGPMPSWPAAAKSRASGKAVIACTIGASGQPLDIKLKSASEPVFGDAALAVMPQWWFLPKVVDGKAVASPAELPFEFTPPK